MARFKILPSVRRRTSRAARPPPEGGTTSDKAGGGRRLHDGKDVRCRYGAASGAEKAVLRTS